MDDFLLDAHPKIVGHLRPRGWSQEDAEDIASEAIERCLRMQRDHPEKTLAKGYLWTAVYHLAADRLRHRLIVEKHRPKFRLPRQGYHVDDYSGITYREALNLLGSYVKPRVVRVFNLRVAGYDYQSISRLTGMSINVLKSIIKKARRSTQRRGELWMSRGYGGRDDSADRS